MSNDIEIHSWRVRLLDYHVGFVGFLDIDKRIFKSIEIDFFWISSLAYFTDEILNFVNLHILILGDS